MILRYTDQVCYVAQIVKYSCVDAYRSGPLIMYDRMDHTPWSQDSVCLGDIATLQP